MGDLLSEMIGGLILAGFILIAIRCVLQIPDLPTNERNE